MPFEPLGSVTQRAKLMRTFTLLGPGILVAATSIGASHIVMSPVAGARFGFDLLWVVVFAHLLKYPAFDFGARFATANGESLLEGYARVPGPRHWPLFVFLFGTVLQGVAVLSGVVSVTAAIAYAGLGGLDLPAWGVVLSTLIVLLLWSGRYAGLDLLNKLMMLVLVSAALVAFFAAPPPARALTHLFVPVVPEGSIFLLAGLMGWMPTGLDVSVWHSLWALEKNKTWREHARRGGGDQRRAVFRAALFDMRVGYVMSLVLGVIFLCLGAILLKPRHLVPQGAAVAETLSEVFTTVLGGWMYPVFITAAFFALFSTAYTVMDGFPRAFAETLRLLVPGGHTTEFRKRSYWVFLLSIYFLAVAFITFLPEPVFLVTAAAALSLLFAPIYYVLNYYCVTRQIQEEAYRPSVASRWVALVGVLFVAVGVILFLYTEIYLKFLAV